MTDNQQSPVEFTIYTKDDCPYCDLAKEFIKNTSGLSIRGEIVVSLEGDMHPRQFKLLAEDHGWTPATVPFIFRWHEDTKSWEKIGGYTDLIRLYTTTPATT